jgi:hypothetical protein
MSDNGKRFIYSGYSIGAAARFDRLEEARNLNHVIPTLGASALSTIGGVSKSQVSNYCYNIEQPRRRCLVSVRRIETTAEGKRTGATFRTEADAEIESIAFVDKLHIGFVKANLISVRDESDRPPQFSTNGNKIEAMSLGVVQAKIVLDEEALKNAGTMAQLADYYKKQSPEYRRQYGWRFNTDAAAPDIAPFAGGSRYKFSIVKEIELVGPEKDKAGISVSGYTIQWDSFGKIILGEVLVTNSDRRVTMVRLAMGSDDGGSGSCGCASVNGSLDS